MKFLAPLTLRLKDVDTERIRVSLTEKIVELQAWAMSTLAGVGGIFTATSPGLAPASGGGSSNFLRADAAWVPIPQSVSSVSAGNPLLVIAPNTGAVVASGVYGNSLLFGDGIDDAPVFDGTSTITLPNGDTIVPSSGIYKLPRTLYTKNATVNTGVDVKLNGWQWFDCGLGTNNGAVEDDGYGSASRSGGWYTATLTGGSGGGGSAGDGSANVIGAPFYSSGMFAGGAGGAGENAAGAGGTATAATGANIGVLMLILLMGATGNNTFAHQLTFGAGGGGGGIGTLGSTGIGGIGGGCCVCAWRKVAGSGRFSANGQPGAAGAGTTNNAQSGGGGGGGGGGGICAVFAESRSGSTTYAASGGLGGAGGTGPGSAGGNGGNGGNGYLWGGTGFCNLSGDGT